MSETIGKNATGIEKYRKFNYSNGDLNVEIWYKKTVDNQHNWWRHKLDIKATIHNETESYDAMSWSANLNSENWGDQETIDTAHNFELLRELVEEVLDESYYMLAVKYCSTTPGKYQYSVSGTHYADERAHKENIRTGIKAKVSEATGIKL